MRQTWIWWLALHCCLALWQPAQAGAARSALIIGVSVYASADVPALAGTTFDIASARRIAQAMGIADAQTTVLRDAQATKAGVLAALQTLAAGTAEGSRVFLYFSGHGTRWFDPQRRGCMEGLLAHDGQAITNEEIAHHTRRIGALADKLVVLFDACHSAGVSGSSAQTRSIASGALTPKFYLQGGTDTVTCSQPSNLRTRSLLAEATRLGALQENLVQISSSRADEVSFDEPGHGGIATQSLRDCLLGQAQDDDGSGAVSMREVEQCAQRSVEHKLRPFADLLPQHISITGNRNLVPVVAIRPPAAVLVAAPAAPPAVAGTAQPPPAVPTPTPTPPAAPPAATPPVAAPPVAAPPFAAPQVVAPPAAMPPVATTPVAPALASLATLHEVLAQHNPARQVDVTLNRTTLRIGQDALELTLRSSHDGHVYLVMLGSDRQSFYLLFPNALDQDNRVRAKATLRLPRPDWRLLAQGPAGTDHLLVLVADTPRDLAALRVAPPDAAAPFTFMLNDLAGRSALIDFFTGSGVRGQSGAFGARLLSLQEIR